MWHFIKVLSTAALSLSKGGWRAGSECPSRGPGSVTSIYIRWLTIACISSSRWSNTFWSSWICAYIQYTYIYIGTHMYTDIKRSLLKKRITGQLSFAPIKTLKKKKRYKKIPGWTRERSTLTPHPYWRHHWHLMSTWEEVTLLWECDYW